MKQHRPFFITRARLAERLVMSGISVTPCENIYQPGKIAWKCALTKPAAEVISAFYGEIGKETPGCVLDALKQ